VLQSLGGIYELEMDALGHAYHYRKYWWKGKNRMVLSSVTSLWQAD